MPNDTIDTRIIDVSSLRSGPFQLTPGVPYDAYAASPVHRYLSKLPAVEDCTASRRPQQPGGCLHDLFPPFATGGRRGHQRQVAGRRLQRAGAAGCCHDDQASCSAGRHAASTAADRPRSATTITSRRWASRLDSIIAGFASAIVRDGSRCPAKPPANQIENPNPQSGTNNWYTQDGYSGGSYSACADTSQPGVGVVVSYLHSLATKIKANCEAEHYYLLNNYNPGYFGDGSVDTTDTFAIPPSPSPSIGNVLLAAHVRSTG